MKNVRFASRLLTLVLLWPVLVLSTAGAKPKKPIKTPIIHQVINVSSNPAGARVYMNDQLVCAQTPGVIDVEAQGTILPNKKNMDAAYAAAKKYSSITLTFVKEGYQPVTKVLEPTISENKVAMLKLYSFDWPKVAHVDFQPAVGGAYEKDPTIPAGAVGERVSRDNAGKTTLERTIIRWFFDSDPQGARIFWRVISSIPSEVKNTNETYLMTTPFEETRSFNIQGLTYENSRDVQIEIKVMKNGYEPQVKRFNVRQAIDQQEISSFFDLVRKEQ